MIRAFVALPIPEDVADRLMAAQSGAPGRVVERDNFHLTLAFVGEHPEPVLEDLHLELEAIAARPVQVAVSGVGAFGGALPRAIYAAVSDDPDLSRLQSKVARAVRAAGIQMEGRRFTPHITLTRVKGEDPAGVSRYVSRIADLSAEPFLARSFTLFQSTLRAGGPIYEPLSEYPLI